MIGLFIYVGMAILKPSLSVNETIYLFFTRLQALH
jgi:hypothetical protein